MQNKENLIALYKDTDFKAAFIANYLECGERDHVAEKEYSNAFAWLAEDTGNDIHPPISAAPVDEIKRTFLAVSTYGLSFDKKSKEVYLMGEWRENNRICVGSILGYRGMQRIIVNTKGVKASNTEIVYENDAFTWLGADQRPNYASDGKSQGSALICGFTTITFDDGTVLCHKTSADELEAIERQSIEQTIHFEGTADASLYNSAWRERCLRICTLRAAFREYRHIFVSNKDVFTEQPQTHSNNDIGAFEKLLNEDANTQHVSNL